MRKSVWDDVTTWRSLSDAASMLRLHKATLSRQVQRGNIAAQVVLEHDLAVFGAERTHSDDERDEQDSANATGGTDAVGKPSLSSDRTSVAPGTPLWILECRQLLAQPTLQADTAPFIADPEAERVYAGSHREADDVTLVELTGLDPAVVRS